MENYIKEILDNAVWAPSGDNSQPWKFEVRQDKLYIFNIPDRDNPILNFKQSGSYVAHGGLIENIFIVAPHLGYNTNIKLFPDAQNEDLVASVSFEKTEIKHSPLFNYIKQRVTNRKPYKNKLLTQEQKNILFENDNIFFTEEKQKRKIIGSAASTMERVALETPSIHKLFFDGILWDKKENENGKSGLYIKTLELPPPIRFAFKFLKYWAITNIFNKIGFSKLAAKGNAATYAKSSALYAVVMENDTKEDFINAGRISQRAWLNATKFGLSVQPVTGILFLARRVLAGDTDAFLSSNIPLIKNAYEKIKSTFGIQDGTIAMMFRIGYANKPTARSFRSSPNITIVLSSYNCDKE
jgi:nitroreductase